MVDKKVKFMQYLRVLYLPPMNLLHESIEHSHCHKLRLSEDESTVVEAIVTENRSKQIATWKMSVSDVFDEGTLPSVIYDACKIVFRDKEAE